MSTPPIALVTDGMWRKSLSAIRSLGKSGYDVHVLGDGLMTVGFWSRFTRQRVRAPDAKDDSRAFGRVLIAHLRTIASSHEPAGRPVVLPMEEETLDFIVNNVGVLEPLCDFIVPDRAMLDLASDKARTMAFAASIGVRHPETVLAATGVELLAAVAGFDARPFVVKPTHGSGSRGVRYEPQFTLSAADEYIAAHGSVLVQERVPADGRAIGVSVLYGRNGRCIASFTHERLQQFPNSGGPSSDRVGIDDIKLREETLRMMSAMHWRGVAMVEWKVDPRTGDALLMEINPRFWGSLELAVRSGVDFPSLYAREAAGIASPSPEAHLGIRCRWLVPGDVLRWLTAERDDRESIRQFVRGLPSNSEEWDPQDVRGFVSCFVCQALALTRPKYLRLMRR